jgi:hypothetical protein
MQLCNVPVAPSFSLVHLLLSARLQAYRFSQEGWNKTLSWVAQVQEQYRLLPGLSFGTADAGAVDSNETARAIKAAVNSRSLMAVMMASCASGYSLTWQEQVSMPLTVRQAWAWGWQTFAFMMSQSTFPEQKQADPEGVHSILPVSTVVVWSAGESVCSDSTPRRMIGARFPPIRSSGKAAMPSCGLVIFAGFGG